MITGLASTPAAVVPGGTATVTATVSGASQCTLASNKPVGDLPATFSCEAGSVQVELVMPVNTAKKVAKYKLTLTASGPGGSRKAKTTVGVLDESESPGNVTSITAGSQHTCALLLSGHLDCWGSNDAGELGDGTTSTYASKPTEVRGISDAAQVSAGGYVTEEDHEPFTQGESCAVLSSGHIECWGANMYGQLGNGTTTNSDVPSEVLGISDATQVSVGQAHACAVLSGGGIDCWGENRQGELGNGTTTTGSTDTPTEVVGITDTTEVSAGGADTCARLSTGQLDCWGENWEGKLGNGTATKTDVPSEVLGITDAARISAGSSSTCAALTSGQVECWGFGADGALGNGTTNSSDSPTEVLGVTGATELATGNIFACAGPSGGHLNCWGDNRNGQLGNGTTTSHDSPVEAMGITNATQVAAGESFACALLSTGHVDCWGDDEFGQLGNLKSKQQDVPTEVAHL